MQDDFWKAALEKAVTIDPECGPAWSMLARLFADIYALRSTVQNYYGLRPSVSQRPAGGTGRSRAGAESGTADPLHAGCIGYLNR